MDSNHGGDRPAGFWDRPLGFPPADWQLQGQTTTLNLYQSMTGLKTAAPGTAAPSLEPRSDPNAVLYEKCRRCQGKQCQPPPRVIPARSFWNILTGPIYGAGPGLKKSTQEHEANADKEVFHDGSQTVFGMHENDMKTIQSEGKRFSEVLSAFPPPSGSSLCFCSLLLLMLASMKRTLLPSGCFCSGNRLFSSLCSALLHFSSSCFYI